MHITVRDRFMLIDAIGMGGMAKVHLARDRRDPFQPPIALKLLRPELAEDPSMVSMFLDEARVTTRLRHPHVVRVFEAERTDDGLVILMEYVEGASLQRIQRELEARGQSMPIGFVVRVILDVLSGLQFAHDLTSESGKPIGIVHRDVSPHNILLGTDGRARIGDFGIAVHAQRFAATQPSGPVKGKLGYLAPEQVSRKESLDRRVDVFATGIVLWECLAGRALFGGTDAEAIASLMAGETITPSSFYRPELPQVIEDVCLQALERDRDRRYATAARFADALKAAAGDDVFTREQISAFVRDLVGEEIAHRRQLIEAANGTPEAAPVQSNTPTLPESAPPPPPVEPPRSAPPVTNRSVAAMAAVGIVALLVGLSVRRAPAPAPVEAPAAAPPRLEARGESSTPDAVLELVDPVETADPRAFDAAAPRSRPRETPSPRVDRRNNTQPDRKRVFMPDHL